MTRAAGIAGALTSVLVSSCGDPASVTLLFPNTAAHDGTRRVLVEVHERDRVCADLLTATTEGDGAQSRAVRSSELDFPFEEVDLERVPSGRVVLFVTAHAGDDDPPFLAGCSDSLDTEGDEARAVEISLDHLDYQSLRLVRAGGDRQVGRPGETLPTPLTARVEAVRGIDPFPIPGVTVRFQVVGPFTISDGAISGEVLTDGAGEAAVVATLGLAPGTGSVVVTTPAVRNMEVSFSASATEDVAMTARQIPSGLGSAPTHLVAGEVTGAGTDLVALGCDGPVAGCSAGPGARPPLGRTVVSLIRDPTGVAELFGIEDVGWLPAGLAVANLDGAGGAEIAVANGRKSADSEGAEVRVLRWDGTGLIASGRYVLTGSNAVGLTAVSTALDSVSLAVATAGRSVDTRSCSGPRVCVEYREICGPGDVCGCPPGEVCSDQLVCVAADDFIVILDPDGTVLTERAPCHEPQFACNPTTMTSSYVCADAVSTANVRDHCDCAVHDAIRLGTFANPLEPRGVVGAALRTPAAGDLIVPTEGGVEFVIQRGGRFSTLTESMLISQEATAALALQLDHLVDPRPDVMWLEPAACTSGMSIDTVCPATAPPSAEHLGCLGIFQTDGAIGDVPDFGACRRHPLPFTPTGFCTGDFNDDGSADVALVPSAGSGPSGVYVFAGDGNGGLLTPRSVIPLPGVGPVVCAELDGRTGDEIAVLEGSTIHLLSRP